MASEERDQLIAHLRRLQLRHAIANLDDLLRDATRLKMGHLGFLARVVEAEVLARTETATNRRVREAHFPEICRIEEYDFKEQVSLDRKQILDLAELGFMDRCESVFFLGPSGVGKSHLSIGLGMRACAAGYRVLYVRAFDMLRELLAALADDTFEEVLERYVQPALLILDEVGNHRDTPSQCNYAGVFYEAMHLRYRRTCTVLCSNLGVNDWAHALGPESRGLVATTLDRLMEGAHIIAFPSDAPSHRLLRQRGAGPLPGPRPRPRRRAREPKRR